MSNTLTAKAVAAFATVAMLASMLFALPARAQTVAELQAQIQSLLATIAQLQAQMAAMQGGAGTSATVPASTNPLCGYTFTENYRLGSRGEGVRKVQQFLNMDPDTRVAVAGPGSPGNETTYYGPATKRAVERFQAKYASAILAPVGLSAPTGVWGPSTRAKANALLQAMCQASAQQPGNQTQTPATTGVTVTAASQPDDSILPKGATNIPFTRFTLTAGADDVEIESVTVKLEGLVEVDAFDAVFLLDEDGNLIGDEEDFDNDTRKAEVGDMFTLRAGQSKTFTVAANRSTATGMAGQVASISVVAINTDAPVHGTLPITGAQHTINETIDIASASVNVDNESGDVRVGDQDVLLATVEVSLNNEDAYLKKLRIRQKASADLTKALKNVVVDVEGEEYDADRVTDEYIYFDFGSGVLVETGSTDIELKADIKGTDDKLSFEIDNESDIVLVGKDYGYNADITSLTADGDELQIKGGSINLDENDNWNPTPVAAGENRATLGSFVLSVYGGDTTADVTIKVKQTSGADADSLDNLAIYDENGKRVSRTKDVTISSVGTEYTVNYENVHFPEGEDMVYYIKADISENADDDDAYQITEVTITDEDDSTRTDTLTNLDEVDVNIGKVELSFKNADDTTVADDQEVELGKIKVDTTGSAYDVELRKVAINIDFSSTSATKNYEDVTDCRLYDENGDSVSEVEDLTSSYYLNFDFPTNPVFDKDTVTELSLKCNLSADFAAGDTLTLDASDSTFDAKAGDNSYNNTTLSGTDASITIATPSLSVKVTGNNVNDDKVVKKDTEVVLGEFELKAEDTAATIRGIQVTISADKLDDARLKVNGSTVDTIASVTGTTLAFNNVSFRLDPNETATLVVEATVDATGDVQVTDIDVDLNNDSDYVDTVDGISENLTLSGTAATVTVVTAIPVFTKIDLGSTLPNEDDTAVLAFKVRADGDDITMGASGQQYINFKVEDNNNVLSNYRLRVYDNPDRTGAYDEYTLTKNSSNVLQVATGTTITVPDGETYSFEVIADVGATGKAGLVRVMVADSSNTAETIVFSAPTDINNKTAGDFLEEDLKQRLDYDYDN